MKKWTVIILCIIILCGTATSYADGEALPLADVYRQIEEEGLSVKWLELEGTYLDFTQQLFDDYFQVQATENGRYIGRYYGPELVLSGGWGKADTDGNLVVPTQYDALGWFSEGLVQVAEYVWDEDGVLSCRAGVMNDQGELVIPMIFDAVWGFEEGLSKAEIDTVWGVSDGYTMVLEKSGVQGYIDRNGEWVLEPKSPYLIDELRDGFVLVADPDYMPDNGMRARALMTMAGELVTGFDYQWMVFGPDGCISATELETHKSGIIDYVGNVIFPFRYDGVSAINKERIIVTVIEGEGRDSVSRCGVVDLEENIIIPIAFDSISRPRREDLPLRAYRMEESQITTTAYFDLDGNEVIAERDIAGGEFDFALAPFTVKDPQNMSTEFSMEYRTGVIDTKGKTVLSPRYQRVKIMSDERAAASFAGAYALFTAEGERITSYLYKSVEEFQNGFAVVERDGYFGMINPQGIEVVPAVFTKMSQVMDGDKVMVSVGSEAGEISRIGILTLDQELEGVTNDLPNFIRASYNGNDIPFDMDPIVAEGRTLVPVRAIFEEAGASVDWNLEEQKVTGIRSGSGRDEVRVVLTIGDRRAYLNGEAVELDVPAAMEGGRTYVPLRFVAESLGMDVDWVEEEQLIILTDERTGAV